MQLKQATSDSKQSDDEEIDIVYNLEEAMDETTSEQSSPRGSEQPMAFITGGSGYVGRNLIRYLTKKNWKIRALARSKNSANAVKQLGAEPVTGDLNSVEAMTKGMEGCDVCFHLAAPVHFWGNVDKYLAITRDGTRNVIKACQDSGCPKLVHLSTIVVLLSKNESVSDLTESMDYRSDIPGVYPICKKEAEILAIEASKSSNLHVTILRPPVIWGNDDTNITPKLVKKSNAHLFQWFNGGEYQYATCHVFNVVHALYLLYAKGKSGEVYFIRDGEKYSFKQFFTDLLTVTGAAKPFMSVPYKGMLCCSLFMDCLFCCGQKWICCQCCEPPFHSALIRPLWRVDCDDSKIRKELGFEDQITIKKGMLGVADRFNIDRKTVESRLLCQSQAN